MRPSPLLPPWSRSSDRRKSFGPSAPIAYATYVSPPDEAVAWPGNSCRMANDATRGVGNSSAQTVDDHVPREWEDPQAKRCGGMERSGSLCGRGCRSAEADVAPLEEIADPRKPMRLQRGRPCRSAGVLRGVLPLRSAVHCCRCEALDLTEREQTHKKRMTIAVTLIPKKSTEYQPSG